MVLTVVAEQVDPREAGTIVRNLGHFVSGALDRRRGRRRAAAVDVVLPDLILTGGETAREVLERIGIRALEPLGAQQHGAVVSLADDGRLVGTKPGSFGDDQALLQLYHSIQSRRASEPAGTARHEPLDPSEKSGEAMNSALNAPEQDTRPVIAVTMGDGAGVGPEVTVGALLAENAYRDCRPVVIGDVYRLELGAKALGVEANIVEIQDVAEAVFEPGRINVIDPKLLPHDLPWGVESAEAGNAAYHYIRIACELGMKRRGAGDLHGAAEQGRAAQGRARLPGPHRTAGALHGHRGSVHDALHPQGQGHPRHHAHRPDRRDQQDRARPGGAHRPARLQRHAARRHRQPQDRRLRHQPARRRERPLRLRRGSGEDHPGHRRSCRPTASTPAARSRRTPRSSWPAAATTT